MLILARRPGESICLGENIRITVLGVQGKQVKIGLDIPPDTTVYREEIYTRAIEAHKGAIPSNNEDLMVALQLWKRKKM